jgi:hypothetical protein
MRIPLPGLILPALGAMLIYAAEMEAESDIKFAIYSRAWGANTNDGMRVVVNNQTNSAVRLHSVEFLKGGLDGAAVTLDLDLRIEPGAYAETDLDYVNLLQNDDCVARTLSENWKLAEISNYTLNPSVRGLIIEDTDSFRIYQCVETVVTRWSDLDTAIRYEKEEWVLFHFESRRN